MEHNVIDSLDPVDLGQRLRSARVARGLTQEDAAKFIGVARTTLIAIESGSRRVRAEELVRLAVGYGHQVSDFVRLRPNIEPLTAQLAQFRGPWQLTDDDKQAIEPIFQLLEELCRNYVELEILTKSPLRKKYPAEYSASTTLSIEELAESIALEERNRLGLGDGPIPQFRDILEQDVGLRIFYIAMPHRFSELYIYTQTLGGCIAVNRNHPEERRRWSLSHAYLHFLMHRFKVDITLDTRSQRRPESERLADAFANVFLMPTAGVTRRFHDARREKGKVSLADLFGFAHFYGVSMEAYVHRLEGLHLVPTGSWNGLRVRGLKVRDMQQRLEIGGVSGRGDLLPLHYQYLALDALDSGEISEGQFAGFLCMDRHAAREHARGIRHETAASSRNGKSLLVGSERTAEAMVECDENTAPSSMSDKPALREPPSFA